MKVRISVIRRTEYARELEMDESKFRRLSDQLNRSSSRKEMRDAEKEINEMIRDEDWQDGEPTDAEIEIVKD